MGDQWLRFLGDCRFTVGSRGGASLPDPYGRRRFEVDDFVLKGILARGTRVDAQGKALGQAILEMPIPWPEANHSPTDPRVP